MVSNIRNLSRDPVQIFLSGNFGVGVEGNLSRGVFGVAYLGIVRSVLDFYRRFFLLVEVDPR